MQQLGRPQRRITSTTHLDERIKARFGAADVFVVCELVGDGAVA
jgi:hypothetical protein